MAYAKKTAQGNYEIFENGQRISTGSKSILVNYGLSETNLGTETPQTPQISPPTPQPLGTPAGFSKPVFSKPTGYDFSSAPSGGIVSVDGKKYIYNEPYLQDISPELGGASAYEVPKTVGTVSTQPPMTATKEVGYTGLSIVDYLNSIGQPSDLTSRATRATQMGFVSSPSEYLNLAKKGQNADINTKMLSALRTKQSQLQSQIPGEQTAQQRQTAFEEAGLTPEQQAGVVSGTGYDALKVLDQYGVTRPDSNINPITAFAITYKNLLTSLGGIDIKSRYDEITKKYAEVQSELNDKIMEVNENPWISEATRSKKVALLQNKYEQKTSDLTRQLTLYENLYDDLRQEAQYVASKALEITHQQAVLDQQTKQKALDRVEKAAEAERKLTKPASSSADLRFTSTQLSKGIFNAGITAKDFQALPYDVQNYFINAPSAQIKEIRDAISNVASGKEEAKDVITEINNSNNSPDTKEYLTRLVNSAIPTSPKTSGWDKIKKWLGI